MSPDLGFQSFGSESRVGRPMVPVRPLEDAPPGPVPPAVRPSTNPATSAGLPAPLPRRFRLEQFAQEQAGEALRHLRQLLGRAGRDDLATARSTLRTEIDHPVGRLDDVEVVL